MKKAAFTLSLLLFSAAFGAMSVNLAKANPAPLFSFPTSPIMTQPTMILTSPVQNKICNTTVELSLTIVKPETWFGIDVGSHLDGSPINQAFVNISSVYYVVDNGERQNIAVHDITSLWDTTPTLTLNLSTTLPLSVGAHRVKVGLEADSYFVVSFTYNLSEALSSVKLHAESVPVNFIVASELEIQLSSFPILPVAVFIVAVVVAGAVLLVHYRKRRKKKNASI